MERQQRQPEKRVILKKSQVQLDPWKGWRFIPISLAQVAAVAHKAEMSPSMVEQAALPLSLSSQNQSSGVALLNSNRKVIKCQRNKTGDGKG